MQIYKGSDMYISVYQSGIDYVENNHVIRSRNGNDNTSRELSHLSH